jgi:tRNA G18 (ribose-2'-O)-methylase SpoU
LLANGDRRNLVDRYRYWTNEAIQDDLAARAHPLHVAIENWEHDFNIGAIVRTANAFAVAGVHIVGRRRWNRRGAMVTDRYLAVTHHPDVDDLATWAKEAGLALIAIENVPGALPLEAAELPECCVLLFGQEGSGLSGPALAAASAVYEISQYGSTRSINAGAAGAIAMYHWALQHAAGRPAGRPSD